MKNRDQKYKLLLLALPFLALVVVLILVTRHSNFQVLNPAGVIASGQRRLIAESVGIMLIIVLPVIGTAYYIAWKYRATNTSTKFESAPKAQSLKWQILWWGLPAIIIFFLGRLSWGSAHALDPYKPIDPTQASLTIQVVALRWKWLFIYPEQNIATVNYIEIPQGTPVHFELTSDGLMNSFWIPQLGSQIYAMAGMETQLNLEASEPGQYQGLAAEINGPGFSGMKFTTKSVSSGDFGSWVNSTKQTQSELNLANFNQLEQPTQDNPEATYGSVDQNLFYEVMSRFMDPQT